MKGLRTSNPGEGLQFEEALREYTGKDELCDTLRERENGDQEEGLQYGPQTS